MFLPFFAAVLDTEQEETLRAYVDPVSKFFEVWVPLFNIELATNKNRSWSDTHLFGLSEEDTIHWQT